MVFTQNVKLIYKHKATECGLLRIATKSENVKFS